MTWRAKYGSVGRWTRMALGVGVALVSVAGTACGEAPAPKGNAPATTPATNSTTAPATPVAAPATSQPVASEASGAMNSGSGVAATTAGTVAAGASAAGASAGAEGALKKYVVGVIAKSDTNAVFKAARTGAFDAAADLSRKHGIEVKIDWRTPTTEDAQKQAQNLDQLVSAGVNGIAISCTDAKVLTSAINAAVDKGVPVITFDSDAPESKRFAYYGIDDVAAGAAVMQHLAKAMGEKGVLAVLAGNQTAPNLQARVRGVQEEMKKYPGITLQAVHYHEESPEKAVAKLEQVQGANPEISGWAMVGGWPLFTENALNKIYRSAKVVSVDTLPQQLQYVENGQVQALIGQDCYGWGYQSVVMLIDKLHLKKDPPKVINNFELQVVTKDNVNDYKGLWEKWLGEKGK
ncbi:MAG: substrate-binding domain-containing protein [Planctomycetota bacterium]|nr:substrate-binding domain-containing protein [Planctomycetota bacterium]